MRMRPFTPLLFLAAGIGQAAAAPTTYVIANNTPRFVSAAQKVSNVDTSQVIDVTVWLAPRNRATLDAMVAKMYDRTQPSYHQWLSREAAGKMLAPAAADVADVTRFLKAGNLAIVAQDKFGLFLRARGTVAAVQTAFNVTLANVTFGGARFRVNMADPAIADPAGAHVMTIEGLDNVGFVHHNIAQHDAIKGRTASAASAAAEPDTTAAPPACIDGTGSQTFVSSGGALPYATYTGNLYNKSKLGCGYTPPQIQAAYGLDKLYAAGHDGTGQTIVILDWCGSPTIRRDANAFSTKYGLPALTSSNFSIVNFPGPSSCSAPDVEINIDVEWAHAIAPGANILLLVPPSPSDQDVDSGLLDIVESDFGNVVSNSYGEEEYYASPTTMTLENFIIETGAAEGIAMNFSTGDDGDFTFDYPQFNPKSVSAPANSPYATGIGGISLQLTPAGAIGFQAPWGTNETLLQDGGFVYAPAANLGFDFGSGGGVSAMFAKPAYQSALAGKFRKLPDISWLADPFTGGYIAISTAFQKPAVSYQVYGGTSLACPMFTALWAIANQVAGASLGQAAPALYAAPASTIMDIVPHNSNTNVTAVFQKSGGKTVDETATALAQPLEGKTNFISALWNIPDQPGVSVLITFGTDSTLKAAPGWDNTTGLGVAKPAALVNYIMSAAASAKP